MSLLLLVIVLMGFGPTFFFRNMYDPNDGHGPAGLPMLLIAHGLIMTAWLLLLVIQTGLVQSNNVKWHMHIGWFGLALAVLVIPTGIMVMVGFGPRLLALGVPPAVLREGLSLMFWIDVFSLILFPSLIGAALYYRKNPDWHKRFMLYAAFTLLVPGLGRLTAQIARTDSFGGINWPLNWILFLLILASVPLYDILKTKRIHNATIIGFIAVFMGMLLSIFISSTDFGKDLASAHFLE